MRDLPLIILSAGFLTQTALATLPPQPATHFLALDLSAPTRTGFQAMKTPLYGEWTELKSGQRTRKLLGSGAAQYISNATYDFETKLGKSVYVTRAGNHPSGRGTSFLVGDNLVLTARHNVVSPSDPRDLPNTACGHFAVWADEDWLECKKVQQCFFSSRIEEGGYIWNEGEDFCLVEMNSFGLFGMKELSDLSDPLPLSENTWGAAATEAILLIGNTGAYGIQATWGKGAEKELNSREHSVLYHKLFTLPGTSGAPLFNTNGEVIGLHFFGSPTMAMASPWMVSRLRKKLPSDVFSRIRIAHP